MKRHMSLRKFLKISCSSSRLFAQLLWFFFPEGGKAGYIQRWRGRLEAGGQAVANFSCQGTFPVHKCYKPAQWQESTNHRGVHRVKDLLHRSTNQQWSSHGAVTAPGAEQHTPCNPLGCNKENCASRMKALGNKWEDSPPQSEARVQGKCCLVSSLLCSHLQQ